MDWIEYVGYLGVVLSSVTFLPQVLQAWKTKSVGDLSIWMVLILIGNVTTWLFYSAVKGVLPMIIANAIILVLSLIMLFFKLTFKK
jgi:MtN3 and saliva related transmembrane protein